MIPYCVVRINSSSDSGNIEYAIRSTKYFSYCADHLILRTQTMSKKLRGVYLITDTHIQQHFSHEELARQAVQAGVRMIQFRDKEIPAGEALTHVQALAEETAGSDTVFIVNDRPDLALAGGADGVHLGQNDLPIPVARRLLGGMVIGGTSSTVEEAVQVEREGADYVALGHIFKTRTKLKPYAPRGLDILKQVSRAVSIPVVAIGGIALENAPRVIEAGADLIAVSSAICKADNPEEAAAKLVDLFR